MSPTLDIPRLLGLWRLGQLELESLITATYTLDQINEGYADLRDGRNIRGVILHDS
jgi:alcohol dehydrogenase (nicotinoprotein)